jgi:hypothetical protein
LFLRAAVGQEGGLEPQPNLEALAAPLPSALVGKDSARHPVEPQAGFVAGRNVLEPPPGDEEGLRYNIRCVLRAAASPQGVAENRLIRAVVQGSEEVAPGGINRAHDRSCPACLGTFQLA